MSVFDRLTALADCLCAEIAASGFPNVCFCGVVPGEVATNEYATNCGTNCGIAWVRLVNMYPSTSVGVADTSIGNCGKEKGFDVELGIMRCFQMSSDTRGNPPTRESITNATALQLADAETMWKAINCCEAIGSHDYVIGQYQPLGPEGNSVGGVWTLSMV